MEGRGLDSIKAKSYAVSNFQEVGRAIMDLNDIEDDPENDISPKTIALEYLTEGFIENHRELFDSKPAGENGERQIVYVGSESNE
jgi:hypothetical protein